MREKRRPSPSLSTQLIALPNLQELTPLFLPLTKGGEGGLSTTSIAARKPLLQVEFRLGRVPTSGCVFVVGRFEKRWVSLHEFES